MLSTKKAGLGCFCLPFWGCRKKTREGFEVAQPAAEAKLAPAVVPASLDAIAIPFSLFPDQPELPLSSSAQEPDASSTVHLSATAATSPTSVQQSSPQEPQSVPQPPALKDKIDRAERDSLGTVTGWQLLAAGLLQDPTREAPEAGEPPPRAPPDGVGSCPAAAPTDNQPYHPIPLHLVRNEQVQKDNWQRHVHGALEASYELLEELGHGAFGQVLKARRRADGAIVCVKLVDLSHLGPAERQLVSERSKYIVKAEMPPSFPACFTCPCKTNCACRAAF